MSRNTTVIFLSIVCGLWAARASADPLSVAVGQVQASAGQDVEIPISIKGVKDLGALQLRLNFDPTVLEGTKVVLGPAAAKTNMEFDIGKEDGRIGMGFYSKPVASDGVAFKVLARVLGATGQKCPLKLDAARAWDYENTAELIVNTEDGEFTVAASMMRIWIAAAVGGLFLLLLLGVRARRHPHPSPYTAKVALAPAHGHHEAMFKHHCSGCHQVTERPQSAIGKQFTCAGCGLVQVGGQ